MTRKWLVTILVSVALCAAPTTASAATFLSGAGGVFTPYEGKAGFTGSVQLLAGTPTEKEGRAAFRFGGEIEYRSYKSKIFDVDDVRFDSGSFRALVQYHFLPESMSPYVSPYVGGGFGFDINVIDNDKVEHALQDRGYEVVSVDKVGFGLDLLGMAGVEVPLGSAVALFAEGRASVAFQLTKQSDFSGSGDIGVSNLGGLTGIGGVRVRF
jgi:hypothetical protein